MQKLQKMVVSEEVSRGARRLEDAVAKMMVRSREGESIWADMRTLKSNEPSMAEAMKQAKIMPRGRGWVDVAFRAGVQKKTKRYIEPSKKQLASPRVRMRLSVKILFKIFCTSGVFELTVAEFGLGS